MSGFRYWAFELTIWAIWALIALTAVAVVVLGLKIMVWDWLGVSLGPVQ